jgi:hypothetical protein
MRIETRQLLWCASVALVLGWASSSAFAQKEVWTDPEDSTLPKDFKIQGEYVGETENGHKVGAQVIALGKGAFQMVFLPGGLPGAGWDGENKILLDGQLQDDGSAMFKPISGKRTYLAQSPKEFSAASKPTELDPPARMNDRAVIKGDEIHCYPADHAEFTLKKTTRKSDSMGKKPPEGAIVLFDGKNIEHWNGGRLDEKTGLLNTDGHDIVTKQKFNNYTMHLEFLLPYRPEARGQGRGNSGFYQVDQYEVQILDSFGLDGKNNECGGVYQLADPKVNMCLPPLVWQTYDVEFTNAKTDGDGKLTAPVKMTVKHNGVVIHEDLELSQVTGGARNEPMGTPGPIKLQGHGNPLQFRNIWIVEK